MPANNYHFVEKWTFPGYPPEIVWNVMADARLLPKWWKGVYLEAEPVGPWLGAHVGGHMKVKARGALPYKLNFILEATIVEPGKVLETKTLGDFEGIWRATLHPEGNGTRADIDWTVVVKKPLIRYLSPILKPLFAWNHYWTTPRGEKGMLEYLAEHASEHTVPPIPENTPQPATGGVR